MMLGSSSMGKSKSLIFPKGVDATAVDDRGRPGDGDAHKSIQSQVNWRLEQCEQARFPFKKKLMLDDLNLKSGDIPVKDLCGTTLGNSLYKLGLAKNRLGSIPAKLVVSLPVLQTLDLSQCELHKLPEHFNLPRLKRLNLRHNRLLHFLDERILEGLPDLQELDMYGNRVSEIIVPTNPMLLTKLETLDLGYNDIIYLPEELDRLKSLRALKLMNNFLSLVPMRVCDMELKVIDVANNPVTTPPLDTCERGIYSMKRYWAQIRLEEQNKKKAAIEVQRRFQQKPAKGYAGRFLGSVMSKKATASSPIGMIPPIRKAISTGNADVDSNSSENLSASSSSVAGRPELSDSLKQSSLSDSLVSPSELALSRDPSHPKLKAASAPDVFESKPDSSERSDLVASDPAIDVPVFDSADQIAINDTLKVIFVGMAMVGKTSMIQRLIGGKDAVVPTIDERTVGVDIYDWEPKNDKRFEHIDARIEIPAQELRDTCGAIDVKFSVWDFAGQHVYHATHELFFSNRALYVLVWDMGATNQSTFRKKVSSKKSEIGAFKLYDSLDEEAESDDEDDLMVEEEERRADKALENDIDEKVQFWVDCIQRTTPGAAILPVASFNDEFAKLPNGIAEAQRRCLVLKQRLMKHEERSLKGIKDRLQKFYDQNRADDPAAIRLRKLYCSYMRPKLIFGPDEDSVVRVSGTEYTGFDNLTAKIVNIATGKDIGSWRYPMFHGHIGARIPRMQLEVRDAVRSMRGRFKVVEWGYFINSLRDRGLSCVEDISDALHFLTNVGELSYFGTVMQESQQYVNEQNDHSSLAAYQVLAMSRDDDADEDEGFSIDNAISTALSTADISSTLNEFSSNGLSQFVFLNPRWLVAAMACVLRHDLDREIKETRRLAASCEKRLSRTASFYDAHLNCPVITADDAYLLWQYKRITKKAAELAQEYSNDTTITPFEFLQLLLVRFGVFVPIDLSIEKALFGGKEYQQLVRNMNADETETASACPSSIELQGASSAKAQYFFLPSLLGPGEPLDAWSHKCSDSSKTTLCHSILYPDGVPPGLMERLTASALSSIYAASNRNMQNPPSDAFVVKEILCWRTAFYVKIGSRSKQVNGEAKESIVEIFTHVATKDSNVCVGSDFMGVGMHRLVTSGRGQIGDGGRNIWNGGYSLVCKSIQRVMAEYSGLEFETQAFCPDCLAKKELSEASSWETTAIRNAVLHSDGFLHCHHGHRVDMRLIVGPSDSSGNDKLLPKSMGGIAIVRDRDRMKEAIDGNSAAFSVSESYIKSAILMKSELGKGFFGTVYRGFDRIIGAGFAIKAINMGILSSGNTDQIQRAKETFVREQQTLRCFRHPNIARLLAYSFPEDILGPYYLVYELAENGSLDSFWTNDLQRLRLPFRRRVQIAVDIVTALQFLHVGNSNKMIKSCFHRDVKSANTVLKRDLTAQLIDCGLATFVVDETNSRRSSLDAKGTPGYICPEYSAGEVKCFDCACDIYSFGVVLVELWTGKLQNCADDNGDAFNFTTQYIKRQEGKTKRDIKVDADSTFGCDPSDELPAFMIRFVELAVACIRDHDVIPDGKDVLDELVAILRSSECAEAGMSYTDRV